MNTTHSPNHLKPGQLVQHPEHGYGIIAISFTDRTLVDYAGPAGDEKATYDLTGWEPIEVVAPGHVQVRVDDLNKNGLRRLGNREEEPNTNTHAQWNAATRVGKAWAAQQQPAQPDEPQEFGARVSVTTSDGTVEKWLRIEGGKEYPSAWSKEHFLTVRTWEELTKRGQVSLGWDDAQ